MTRFTHWRRPAESKVVSCDAMDAPPGPCGLPGIDILCGEIFTDAQAGVAAPPDASPVAAPADSLRVRLDELDGVFGALLRVGGQAWAYRDPSGLCSVFAQRRAGGDWRVCGSLRSLVQDALRPTDVDRRALHEYLRLLDIAAPRAWYRGVQAVEPGQALGLGVPDAAGPEQAPRPPAPAPSSTNVEDTVRTLDLRLRGSVERCLSGAERPAAFLSGGIDSALLLAIGVRQAPEITAVTVGFEGVDFDEAPVAARIASHLGVRHQVLRFDRDAYLAAFDRLARGMDQPMADPATMATLLAFEHCREHFDVVLDGAGADEAVGVMPPRHARAAVEFGSLVSARLRRVLVRAMRHMPGLAGYTPILDFEHPAETLMRWKGFTRREIEALCGEPVALEDTTFYRTYARYPRQAHFERSTALLNVMPADRVIEARRLSGLCVRHPYCARDVDAFLRQLPTEWRYSPGHPKRILRELLARYVPAEIWDRPKQGFNFPLHDFLAGQGFALVRRHVLEGRWLDRGLLRPELVRCYAHRYMAGDRQLMFRVWALVVLGAWLDAHGEVEGPSARG